MAEHLRSKHLSLHCSLRVWPGAGDSSLSLNCFFFTYTLAVSGWHGPQEGAWHTVAVAAAMKVEEHRRG
jgi:hypothetical protein